MINQTDENVEAVAKAIFNDDWDGHFDWSLEDDLSREDYRDNARAAIAAMPAPTVGEWQPIETAPDRVDLLVYHEFALPDGSIDRQIWVDFMVDQEWAIYPSLIHICGLPTHWMPLPTPPQEGTE